MRVYAQAWNRIQPLTTRQKVDSAASAKPELLALGVFAHLQVPGSPGLAVAVHCKLLPAVCFRRWLAC